MVIISYTIGYGFNDRFCYVAITPILSLFYVETDNFLNIGNCYIDDYVYVTVVFYDNNV